MNHKDMLGLADAITAAGNRLHILIDVAGGKSAGFRGEAFKKQLVKAAAQANVSATIISELLGLRARFESMSKEVYHDVNRVLSGNMIVKENKEGSGVVDNTGEDPRGGLPPGATMDDIEWPKGTVFDKDGNPILPRNL